MNLRQNKVIVTMLSKPEVEKRIYSLHADSTDLLVNNDIYVQYKMYKIRCMTTEG